MKLIKTKAIVAGIAICACSIAFAGSKADIHILTQNQYLGADLAPIIEADTQEAVNAAIINALLAVANNNFPERVEALAESIADKQPHLVALQEVYEFACVDPFNTQFCGLFQGAFNDHLTATVAALDGQYQIAATVQNLTLPPAYLPVPGIPVYLSAESPPVFIQVVDRDVILARSDVETTPVNFACPRPSADGCNYEMVAQVTIDTLPINIERGYVAVDTTINGAEYRFFNTHLEIKQLGDNFDSQFLQPAQSTELWGAILDPSGYGKRLVVAGDFNSDPRDVLPFNVPTAYQQLTGGVLINGYELPIELTDTWNLRPGKPPGYTCCEPGDLSNVPSQHYERVDLVFAFPAPSTVKANVLNDEVDDKTPSGLWPSDHASVSVEISY